MNQEIITDIDNVIGDLSRIVPDYKAGYKAIGSAITYLRLLKQYYKITETSLTKEELPNE